MRSHYTLVSLKGQHISLVPAAIFASRSSQVITQTQHSRSHSFAEEKKNPQRQKNKLYRNIFCIFYTTFNMLPAFDQSRLGRSEQRAGPLRRDAF